MRNLGLRWLALLTAYTIVSYAVFNEQAGWWLYAAPALGSIHGVLFSERPYWKRGHDDTGN